MITYYHLPMQTLVQSQVQWHVEFCKYMYTFCKYMYTFCVITTNMIAPTVCSCMHDHVFTSKITQSVDLWHYGHKDCCLNKWSLIILWLAIKLLFVTAITSIAWLATYIDTTSLIFKNIAKKNISLSYYHLCGNQKTR